MTKNELIARLIRQYQSSDATRITVRIEHEDVFAFYDLEDVEFDPFTNEFYITTKDTRSINQKYADDSDTHT